MESRGAASQSCSLPPEKEMGDWDSAVGKLTAGFLRLLEIVNGTQVCLRRVLEYTSLRTYLL